MAHLIDSVHDQLNHQAAKVGDTFELNGALYTTEAAGFLCNGCAFRRPDGQATQTELCKAAPDCVWHNVVFVAAPR